MAELLAVSVRTLVVLVGFWLNDAVTPLGRPPETAIFTLLEKSPRSVTVIVEVPEAPWTIFRELVEVAREKPGATYIIPIPMLVLSVSVPEVPVTVTKAFPGVAVVLAVSVSTLVPVLGFGVIDAVRPLVRPVTARFTLPANPASGDTQMVEVREAP